MNKINFLNNYKVVCLKPKTNDKNEKSLPVNQNKIRNAFEETPLSLTALKNYNLCSLAFGNKVDSFKTSLVYNDFSSHMKKEHENILGFIEKTELKPSEAKGLLEHITCNENLSDVFIKQITADPRKSAQITRTLTDKLGGKDNFTEWYYSKNGYFNAYEKFNEKQYNQAQTVEDLLKIRPDWNIWQIKNKYAQYIKKTEGNENQTNFVIGEVPTEFGGRAAFYGVIKSIKQNKTGQININNQKYDVNRIAGDLSDKAIYEIKTGTKDYILKIDKNPDDETAKDNKSLKADSGFLNAVVDFYLNSHNAKNNVKMFYYDFYNNASLCEKVKGEKYTSTEMTGDFVNPISLNNSVSDLNRLGIYCNDVHNSGFITDINDNNVKSIDSGHVSYIDVLKPQCRGYHAEISNCCGFNTTKVFAGLALAESALLKQNKDI